MPEIQTWISRCTFRWSTKVGFVDGMVRGSRGVGGWHDRKAEALARFGRHVDVAFQITDDVLDYVGEEGQTGKKARAGSGAAQADLAAVVGG